MKNKRVFLSIGIFVLISAIVLVFTSNSNQTVELTENQKLFNELNEKYFGEFSSDKYLIKDGYISKIYPGTKIKDFINELHEDVVIYENEKQVTDGFVKTGMVLKLHDLTFTLLVTGDLNNDGKFNQIDLNRIIRFIGKEDITDVEKVLSDLTGDGSVTEEDAGFGADYLLGKSKLKFTESSVFEANVNLVGAALGNDWYNTDVSIVIPYFGYGYEYEVFGTKEISRSKGAATTTLTFNENGAYLVNVYYYANDGNTIIYNYVFGIDYSRNKCNDLGVDTLSDCMLVNDAVSYLSVEEAKTGIKKKTTDLTQISTIDEGLLSIKDKDGDAFYYRGAVKDNYVEFAGHDWKIVRRNGDGSVRLVYADNIGSSNYGSSMSFNASGYKYNTDLKYGELNDPVPFTFNSYTSVTFSDNYVCDDSKDVCSLTGNTISGKFSEISDKVFGGDSNNNGIPYKYFMFTTANYVSVVYEVVEHGYENGDVMVKRRGYLEQNNPKDKNSVIKTFVDGWYASEILNETDSKNNKWSEYLVDKPFCEDKSWSIKKASNSQFFNSGYDRLSIDNKPSLICSSVDNEYSVSNGALEYPVGLLTADEVVLAGALPGKDNSSYWLFVNNSFWTMTPAYVSSMSPGVYHYSVTGNGGFTSSPSGVSSQNKVRPVINLSKDVLFTGGSGTADDPYQVALSK